MDPPDIESELLERIATDDVCWMLTAVRDIEHKKHVFVNADVA